MLSACSSNAKQEEQAAEAQQQETQPEEDIANDPFMVALAEYENSYYYKYDKSFDEYVKENPVADFMSEKGIDYESSPYKQGVEQAFAEMVEEEAANGDFKARMRENRAANLYSAASYYISDYYTANNEYPETVTVADLVSAEVLEADFDWQMIGENSEITIDPKTHSVTSVRVIDVVYPADNGQ